MLWYQANLHFHFFSISLENKPIILASTRKSSKRKQQQRPEDNLSVKVLSMLSIRSQDKLRMSQDWKTRDLKKKRNIVWQEVNRIELPILSAICSNDISPSIVWPSRRVMLFFLLFDGCNLFVEKKMRHRKIVRHSEAEHQLQCRSHETRILPLIK